MSAKPERERATAELPVLLLLHPEDNVAVATRILTPAETVTLPDGRLLTVVDEVPPAHKVAIAPIGRGEVVHKYGTPIGTATADIAGGEHVHTHNVASDRLRGDR